GDILTEIDSQPLKGLGIEKVIEWVRGPADTAVHLRALRQGKSEPLEFAIIRRPIQLPSANVEVKLTDSGLVVEATGQWSVLDFPRGTAVPIRASSKTDFFVDSGAHTRLTFLQDSEGKFSAVVLNRGDHEITARKID